MLIFASWQKQFLPLCKKNFAGTVFTGFNHHVATHCLPCSVTMLLPQWICVLVGFLIRMYTTSHALIRGRESSSTVKNGPRSCLCSKLRDMRSVCDIALNHSNLKTKRHCMVVILVASRSFRCTLNIRSVILTLTGLNYFTPFHIL